MNFKHIFAATLPDVPTHTWHTDRGPLEAYYWNGRNVYYLNGVKLQDTQARSLLGVLGISHNEAQSNYDYTLAYEAEYNKRMRN